MEPKCRFVSEDSGPSSPNSAEGTTDNVVTMEDRGLEQEDPEHECILPLLP